MQKWLMSFSMGVILRRSASGGYEFDIKKVVIADDFSNLVSEGSPPRRTRP